MSYIFSMPVFSLFQDPESQPHRHQDLPTEEAQPDFSQTDRMLDVAMTDTYC